MGFIALSNRCSQLAKLCLATLCTFSQCTFGLIGANCQNLWALQLQSFPFHCAPQAAKTEIVIYQWAAERKVHISRYSHFQQSVLTAFFPWTFGWTLKVSGHGAPACRCWLTAKQWGRQGYNGSALVSQGCSLIHHNRNMTSAIHCLQALILRLFPEFNSGAQHCFYFPMLIEKPPQTETRYHNVHNIISSCKLTKESIVKRAN